MSIRYRILIPLGLLLLGIIIVSSWSARVAAKKAEARVAAQVEQIGMTLQNGRFPLTAAVLEQVKQLSGAEFCVYFPDGRRLKTKDENHTPDERAETPSGELGPQTTFGQAQYRDSTRILKEPNINAGTRVHILYPESLLNEVIADAIRPSLIHLGLGLLAVMLLFILADSLVRRIRLIEQRTRRIAAGDFSPMPESATHDELHELIRSINAMATNLAQWQHTTKQNERLQLSSQLATGLAHQLRNGVTGAQLALEIAIGDPDDPEAIPIVKRQLHMMDANIRRFISLAKDEGIVLSPCDLISITHDAIELFLAQAKHAAIQLTFHKPIEPVWMRGNAGSLSDIVINLVSNAIDAVGHDGQVNVEIRTKPEAIILDVRDTGPGPDARQQEHIFEPFVTGKPEGIGLGLAVVKNAVLLHQGEITWFRDHQETVFRVVWPSSNRIDHENK